MNPSSAPGRARRASAFRRHTLWTHVLVLTLSCARHESVSEPRALQDPKAVTAAPSAAALGPREGRTHALVGESAPGASREHQNQSHHPVFAAPPAAAARPLPKSAAARGWRTEVRGLGSLGVMAEKANGPSVARPSLSRRGLVAAPAAPDADTEAYAPVVENPFLAVNEHPLSTFSSDVDTASYSNARRFLGEGRLPPEDAVRIEEWLNYFAYDYAPPAGDAPVAIRTEVSDCPWSPSHRLVRIGIKARPIEQANTPPRNLVFLIDVSGSMMPANKLPLLKRGLSLLARTLRPEDHVAMVVYAGSSGLVLPSTSGEDQDKILDALDALEAGGSTNGGQGIELAYRVAQEHFQRGGINRVVLATDGDFNVGTTSEGELARLIEEKRKTGVFLTVLGFGEGNVKDSTMEMLADKGNGNYAYVDSLAEARKVLVREAGSTLVTVAKDVKLQAEFNPARVQSYRLIGYENRLLAEQDFNDDKKDAGDMGAGHAVTALYEVVPVGATAPAGQAPPASPLKYQTDPTLAPASAEPELLTVSVRYKAPLGNTSEKISAVVLDHPVPFANASADHRFAAAVAEFGQILRSSKAVGTLGLDQAKRTAALALGADATGDRRELLALIDRAIQISQTRQPNPLTSAE